MDSKAERELRDFNNFMHVRRLMEEFEDEDWETEPGPSTVIPKPDPGIKNPIETDDKSQELDLNKMTIKLNSPPPKVLTLANPGKTDIPDDMGFKILGYTTWDYPLEPKKIKFEEVINSFQRKLENALSKL